MEHKTINLLNIPSLQKVAGFTKDYLQLGGVSEEVAQYFADRESKQRQQSDQSES